MEEKSYLCPLCGQQTLLLGFVQDGDTPLCDLCVEFHKDIRDGLWNSLGSFYAKKV